MIPKWLESAVDHTNPLVLSSVFASTLAPSVLLLYTGTYNIWFHMVFLVVAAGCFGGLLLHVAGLHARMARRDREQRGETGPIPGETLARTRALDRMKRAARGFFGRGVRLAKPL